jgi:hypothetical protein
MNMKITVITGTGGKVIATARHVETKKPEAGNGGFVAGRGQSVHVIELPKELEKIEDAGELHRRLKELVSKKAKSSPKK